MKALDMILEYELRTAEELKTRMYKHYEQALVVAGLISDNKSKNMENEEREKEREGE
jgi:hypothetical protein